MVKLKNVFFEYNNGTKALRDINIHIDKGEFVFIVGSSGAGKSSLLKLLLRENISTSGGVSVNGYDLNKLKNRHVPKFRRTVGVVFQDFRLIPTLNIFDNIAFSLRVIGMSRKNISLKVNKVLKKLGLTEKAKAFPTEISGGEQQRVALARAIVNNPKLLIADEPTGNIDPDLSFDIINLLKNINKSGTTVIMVTHEHDLVNSFGGRTINIENGKIYEDTFIGGKNENK